MSSLIGYSMTLNGLTVGKLNWGQKAADTLSWAHAVLLGEKGPLGKGNIFLGFLAQKLQRACIQNCDLISWLCCLCHLTKDSSVSWLRPLLPPLYFSALLNSHLHTLAFSVHWMVLREFYSKAELLIFIPINNYYKWSKNSRDCACF